MSCFALFIYLFLESDSKTETRSFVGLEGSVSRLPASRMKKKLFHLFNVDLESEAGNVFFGSCVISRRLSSPLDALGRSWGMQVCQVETTCWQWILGLDLRSIWVCLRSFGSQTALDLTLDFTILLIIHSDSNFTQLKSTQTSNSEIVLSLQRSSDQLVQHLPSAIVTHKILNTQREQRCLERFVRFSPS